MQRGLWEGDRAVRGCRFDDAAAIKVAAMAGDLIQQGVGVDDGRAAIPRCHPLPFRSAMRCHQEGGELA